MLSVCPVNLLMSKGYIRKKKYSKLVLNAEVPQPHRQALMLPLVLSTL
jgi:hypothetical protein